MPANFDHLQPLARESTASAIATQIRESIITGLLPPGSPLTEVELSKRFQVSRGPVREALQRLIQEGLVRGDPHRGASVVVLTPDDYADIYLARAAIEQAAALEVLRAKEPERVELLAAVLAEMRAAAEGGEPGAFPEADLHFHSELVRLSGSMRLQRTFTTLLAETRLCLAALRPAHPVSADRVLAAHERIVAALRSEDAGMVTETIDFHMHDALLRLEGREPEPPAGPAT